MVFMERVGEYPTLFAILWRNTMAYNKTEQQVFDLALPMVENAGLSMWDVEYKKEGSDYYLRVFVDKEDGVCIDDCEKISRELSDKLDELDFIKEAYMLEVCSAGLDRQLKRESDFLAFLGSEVDVKLYAPIDGKKEFCATLLNYNDGIVTLSYDGKEIEVSLDKTASIRLAVIF